MESIILAVPLDRSGRCRECGTPISRWATRCRLHIDAPDVSHLWERDIMAGPAPTFVESEVLA